VHNGATACIDNYSINISKEVFEERLISHRLWPARSPDLNPCKLYLWENLKNKVYSNNPSTVKELTQYICDTITSGQ
jgi:hypothetical protein